MNVAMLLPVPLAPSYVVKVKLSGAGRHQGTVDPPRRGRSRRVIELITDVVNPALAAVPLVNGVQRDRCRLGAGADVLRCAVAGAVSLACPTRTTSL